MHLYCSNWWHPVVLNTGLTSLRRLVFSWGLHSSDKLVDVRTSAILCSPHQKWHWGLLVSLNLIFSEFIQINSQLAISIFHSKCLPGKNRFSWNIWQYILVFFRLSFWPNRSWDMNNIICWKDENWYLKNGIWVWFYGCGAEICFLIFP